jgi:CBS domain-containing protein
MWASPEAGPVVVAADQPLVEAARLMKEHRVDVLAVVDGHGQPVGIITAKDLIRAVARQACEDPACADHGDDHVGAGRR